MLMGYVMPMFEAHATLSKEEFEDSSVVDKFVADNKLQMEMLDFDSIIFIVADVENAISLGSVSKLRKKYASKIQEVRKILEAHNFDSMNLSLVSEPVWSRHGEPLTEY